MATTKPISWSFSKLADFQRCRLSFKIKHIDRIPEPERPLPKGKSEQANDRGTRIHDNIEGYVRGDHDALCDEADKHFGTQIDLLRVLFAEGKVEMEGQWAYDRDWEVAPWDTGWLRMKLDVLVHHSKYQAEVRDWKTGRHFGNEVSHGNQLNLYAVSTFLRFPELEEIMVADDYIDHGISTERHFTRDQALRFKRTFDAQGTALTDATSWPANANKFSCQWCPYGKLGTGHCTFGDGRKA